MPPLSPLIEAAADWLWTNDQATIAWAALAGYLLVAAASARRRHPSTWWPLLVFVPAAAVLSLLVVEVAALVFFMMTLGGDVRAAAAPLGGGIAFLLCAAGAWAAGRWRSATVSALAGLALVAFVGVMVFRWHDDRRAGELRSMVSCEHRPIPALAVHEPVVARGILVADAPSLALLASPDRPSRISFTSRRFALEDLGAVHEALERTGLTYLELRLPDEPAHDARVRDLLDRLGVDRDARLLRLRLKRQASGVGCGAWNDYVAHRPQLGSDPKTYPGQDCVVGEAAAVSTAEVRLATRSSDAASAHEAMLETADRRDLGSLTVVDAQKDHWCEQGEALTALLSVVRAAPKNDVQ